MMPRVRLWGDDPGHCAVPEEVMTCGGRAGKAELLTGIEGASSRPVRRIVLRDG